MGITISELDALLKVTRIILDDQQKQQVLEKMIRMLETTDYIDSFNPETEPMISPAFDDPESCIWEQDIVSHDQDIIVRTEYRIIS